MLSVLPISWRTLGDGTSHLGSRVCSGPTPTPLNPGSSSQAWGSLCPSQWGWDGGCRLKGSREDGPASWLQPFTGHHSLESLPTSYTKAIATYLRGFMEFVPFSFVFLVKDLLGLVVFSFVAARKKGWIRFNFSFLQSTARALSALSRNPWLEKACGKMKVLQRIFKAGCDQCPSERLLLPWNASPFPSHGHCSQLWLMSTLTLKARAVLVAYKPNHNSLLVL